MDMNTKKSSSWFWQNNLKSSSNVRKQDEPSLYLKETDESQSKRRLSKENVVVSMSYSEAFDKLKNEALG